jgi:hypothetical protein
MIQRLLELLHLTKPRQPRLQQTDVVGSAVYVTMDWAGNPITTKGNGYILPRTAEMILNNKYYPNGIVGEWPCDPETGQKLPSKAFINKMQRINYSRSCRTQNFIRITNF